MRAPGQQAASSSPRPFSAALGSWGGGRSLQVLGIPLSFANPGVPYSKGNLPFRLLFGRKAPKVAADPARAASAVLLGDLGRRGTCQRCVRCFGTQIQTKNGVIGRD